MPSRAFSQDAASRVSTLLATRRWGIPLILDVNWTIHAGEPGKASRQRGREAGP